MTNLFTYAVLRLTPHALTSNTSSWSYLRKGTSAPNVAANSAVSNAGSASEGYPHRSRDTSPGGRSQRYRIPRPLQRDKWSKRKDGFVVTDVWGEEVGTSIPLSPTLWLLQTEERVYLCVYQHRNLTVILLIPVCSMINGEQGLSLVKKQLLENVSILSAIDAFLLFCLCLSLFHVCISSPALPVLKQMRALNFLRGCSI